MADIDINPFGEHESRPDEPMGENIPPVIQGEYQLGNQNVNKKHHSEEEKVKEIGC